MFIISVRSSYDSLCSVLKNDACFSLIPEAVLGFSEVKGLIKGWVGA